mmetsp:Transcript_16799/g.27150  ORF Transcript_16799/g.27150 Transcript_16799/m.27150 type:complete len:102 (+) Transcript_16799:183-488(+)
MNLENLTEHMEVSMFYKSARFAMLPMATLPTCTSYMCIQQLECLNVLGVALREGSTNSRQSSRKRSIFIEATNLSEQLLYAVVDYIVPFQKTTFADCNVKL